MNGIKISELNVGDSASFSKTISEYDVYGYAGITGDFNPAHVNAAAAGDSRFGQRIAHGMLSAGLISTVLGTLLPGPGTLYLGQTLTFTKPVLLGDTVTATATVNVKKNEKNIVELTTVCTNQRGEVVVEGTATVMPPK